MSDCIGCDNSNTTYSRCNPPVSTNCVFYQGDSKTCEHDPGFSICKGDNLSNVQGEIFDKICQLIGDTDVSTVNIPCLLEPAWIDQDKTILNYFNYILEVACTQKQAITEINDSITTVDPLVSVCLKCCEGSSCNTPQIRLSEALEKIINCLCEAKARITSLEETVKILETDLDDVKSTYKAFNNFISIFTCVQSQIDCRLDYIDNNLGIDSKASCFPCP